MSTERATHGLGEQTGRGLNVRTGVYCWHFRWEAAQGPSTGNKEETSQWPGKEIQIADGQQYRPQRGFWLLLSMRWESWEGFKLRNDMSPLTIKFLYCAGCRVENRLEAKVRACLLLGFFLFPALSSQGTEVLSENANHTVWFWESKEQLRSTFPAWVRLSSSLPTIF